MKFFNKKQDVIDIQLTSYGKKKLANGKFKPTYYCFFDDNVIYDGAYAGITELQNNIQTRILENMEYLKINPISKGPETKLKEANKASFEGEDDVLDVKDYYGDALQNVEDRDTICKYKLGNSTLGSQLAPKLHISSFGSPFSTENYKDTYSESGIVQEIPQINVSLGHTASVRTSQTPERSIYQKELYPEDLTIFPLIGDKVDIQLEGGFLVMDVGEDNVDYFKENFEFEVFEVVKKEKRNKTNPSEIIDVVEELVPLQMKNVTNLPSSDPEESYSHNYLEIMTDRDVPLIFREALGSLANYNNPNLPGMGEDESSTAATDSRNNAGSNPYAGNSQDPEDCK